MWVRILGLTLCYVVRKYNHGAVWRSFVVSIKKSKPIGHIYIFFLGGVIDYYYYCLVLIPAWIAVNRDRLIVSLSVLFLVPFSLASARPFARC